MAHCPSGGDPRTPRRLVDSKEVGRGGFLTFLEETFESPAGERFVRWIVEHPGAVAAVPVEDGPDGPQVVLVRQWRPVMRDFLLEVPAGKLDVEGEPPDEAMARELAEEIQQRPGRLVKLSTFWNSPGFSTELTHVYIALDLSPCDRPEAAKEEEQDMTIERFPLADTGRLVATGEITDAKTIIGLALAERYLAGLEPEAGS
ncbi:MAG TPA: NUDIX hydrolase [Acidimicrobiia bacterium]|nr:NUDIX hydrolase [Acidimicrobiia bacterium]